MTKMSEKIAMAGLGALVVSRKKAERLIDELVEQGEMDGEEIKQFFNDLVDRGRSTKSRFVSKGRNNRNDIADLELRVSKIEHMLGIEQQDLEQYPSQQPNYDEWRKHDI